MNLLPSAVPWRGLLFYPALLIFLGIMLFSTAFLAFYVKQTISFGRLQYVFARNTGLTGNILAALLGAATPFCTCTAIPLFLGMLEVEVPLGPAISFLLASPTMNLGAVILFLLVFGWRVTLYYAGISLLSAVIVGWLFGRIPRKLALRMFFWVEDEEPGARRVALRKSFLLGRQLTFKFLPWLALATLVGLLIDYLVPTSTVVQLNLWVIWLAIPAAALLGSIIYADILLLIPLGYALMQHGISPAIVLTFMLAASGLSLPELFVLGRILRPWPLVLFVSTTVLVYMLLGFGFLML
jgi:uncharacterized membrane protein YraQ (UPF0718 family)